MVRSSRRSRVACGSEHGGGRPNPAGLTPLQPFARIRRIGSGNRPGTRAHTSPTWPLPYRRGASHSHASRPACVRLTAWRSCHWGRTAAVHRSVLRSTGDGRHSVDARSTLPLHPDWRGTGRERQDRHLLPQWFMGGRGAAEPKGESPSHPGQERPLDRYSWRGLSYGPHERAAASKPRQCCVERPNMGRPACRWEGRRRPTVRTPALPIVPMRCPNPACSTSLCTNVISSLAGSLFGSSSCRPSQVIGDPSPDDRIDCSFQIIVSLHPAGKPPEMRAVAGPEQRVAPGLLV